jgi:hypothetical protein
MLNRTRTMMLLGLAIAATAIVGDARAADRVEHFLCGRIAPFVAVTELPGITSATVACSPVNAYGLGAWRDGVDAGSPTGPLTVGALSIEKARDASSIPMRRSAFLNQSLGVVRLISIRRSSPGGAPLLESEIRLDQTIALAVRTDTQSGEGSEVIELSGRRYEFNSWAPAAAPGSPPTISYCRDLASGNSVCPAPL